MLRNLITTEMRKSSPTCSIYLHLSHLDYENITFGSRSSNTDVTQVFQCKEPDDVEHKLVILFFVQGV